jgi:hypothetical protein
MRSSQDTAPTGNLNPIYNAPQSLFHNSVMSSPFSEGPQRPNPILQTTPLVGSLPETFRVPESPKVSGKAKVPELLKNATVATTGKRNLIVCIDGTSNQFSEKVVCRLLATDGIFTFG